MCRYYFIYYFIIKYLALFALCINFSRRFSFFFLLLLYTVCYLLHWFCLPINKQNIMQTINLLLNFWKTLWGFTMKNIATKRYGPTFEGKKNLKMTSPAHDMIVARNFNSSVHIIWLRNSQIFCKNWWNQRGRTSKLVLEMVNKETRNERRKKTQKSSKTTK